jgi:tRNA dimethylallyltransferase
MLLTGKPLVVILGPTAVGKTGVSIEAARALNGEIIGADSRQIYRFMDIGTAKPDAAQQALAPHHLIDVVNPDENLSLAQYQQLAYATIDAIHARGRLPLLVGGTGQYITALVEGWSAPQVPPNTALRAELETFAAEHGAAALHERLRALDPAAADSIDYRNVRRVVRALEVCIDSGQPFSAQQRKTPPPYRILTLGLTLERALLYERADQRIETMIAAGFIEEVRRLLAMGYPRDLPSMSGLGYVQLAAHLLDDLPLSEAIASTRQATRDFIRRQYTWFRGHDHDTVWYNMEDVQVSTIIAWITDWLSQHTDD